MLCARRCPIPTTPRYTPLSAIPWQRRLLSTSVPRRSDEPPKHDPTLKPTEEQLAEEEVTDESENESVQQFLEALSKVPPSALMEEFDAIPENVHEDADHYDELGPDHPYGKGLEQLTEEEQDMLTAPEPFEKITNEFWDQGEDEHLGEEDFFGDDISSHGHGELEQHRELREYARLAAWELPLLSSTHIILNRRHEQC